MSKEEYIVELNKELLDLTKNSYLHVSREVESIEGIGPALEGIKLVDHGRYGECGTIYLDEYISEYMYDLEQSGKPRNVYGTHNPFSSMGNPPRLTDEQYQKIDDFEKKNIPSSGPCSTRLGEMFRALQRIEYRAGNDGDVFHTIGTPSFRSFLYFDHMIDVINWTDLYEKEVDIDEEIMEGLMWENKIGWDFFIPYFPHMKLLLLTLVEKGYIKDSKNEYDSRSFEFLEKEESYSRYY